jgi:hypothetical protein
MRSALAWIGLGLAIASVPVIASAQDTEDDEAPAWTKGGAPTSEETEETASASDDQAEEGDKTAEKPATIVPSEAPTWWFGAYVNGNFVPSFMLKLFLDDAPTVSNVAFGFTATHRSKDGMSIVMGIGYAPYSFHGPFRISGDPDTDTEWLDSNLGLLHLRGELLWSTEIVPDKLSFEYGVGLDVGVVLGSMVRTEAYRDASGTAHPCVGPLNPNPVYCELPQNLAAGTDAYNQHGAQYHVVEKRVPPVALVPMLPVLALRYTPIRELAVKLDFAFGLMQFAVGVSAAYGVNL